MNLFKEQIYLIDRDYQIVYSNDLKLINESAGIIEKNKCYSAIFHNKSPCPHCSLNFKHDPANEPLSSENKRQVRIQSQSGEAGVQKEITLIQAAMKTGDKIFFLDILEQSPDEFNYNAGDQLMTLGAHVQTVAHELSNPITGLNLTQQQMERLIDSRENVNSYELKPLVNLLSQDIRRAAAVVSEIRNYSRPVSNSYKIFELKPVIKAAIQNVERLYSAEKITVNFNWELPNHFIISGNATKLEQCFINIIRNSFEMFSLRKNISKPEVNISVQGVAGEKTKIQIIDNAGGISNDALKNVFKPYFTTKEKFRGLGLGLYLAGKIIKEHQSTIHMESIEDRTIVTIYMKRQVNVQ